MTSPASPQRRSTRQALAAHSRASGRARELYALADSSLHNNSSNGGLLTSTSVSSSSSNKSSAFDNSDDDGSEESAIASLASRLSLTGISSAAAAVALPPLASPAASAQRRHKALPSPSYVDPKICQALVPYQQQQRKLPEPTTTLLLAAHVPRKTAAVAKAATPATPVIAAVDSLPGITTRRKQYKPVVAVKQQQQQQDQQQLSSAVGAAISIASCTKEEEEERKNSDRDQDTNRPDNECGSNSNHSNHQGNQVDLTLPAAPSPMAVDSEILCTASSSNGTRTPCSPCKFEFFSTTNSTIVLRAVPVIARAKHELAVSQPLTTAVIDGREQRRLIRARKAEEAAAAAAKAKAEVEAAKASASPAPLEHLTADPQDEAMETQTTHAAELVAVQPLPPAAVDRGVGIDTANDTQQQQQQTEDQDEEMSCEQQVTLEQEQLQLQQQQPSISSSASASPDPIPFSEPVAVAPIFPSPQCSPLSPLSITPPPPPPPPSFVDLDDAELWLHELGGSLKEFTDVAKNDPDALQYDDIMYTPADVHCHAPCVGPADQCRWCYKALSLDPDCAINDFTVAASPATASGGEDMESKHVDGKPTDADLWQQYQLCLTYQMGEQVCAVITRATP